MSASPILTSTAQVIDALGGNAGLAAKLDVTRQNPDNWRRAKRFPGWTRPEISTLLIPLGLTAAPELFAGKPRSKKRKEKRRRKPQRRSAPGSAAKPREGARLS